MFSKFPNDICGNVSLGAAPSPRAGSKFSGCEQGLITEKAQEARASPLKFQRGPKMTYKLYLQFPLFFKEKQEKIHIM